MGQVVLGKRVTPDDFTDFNAKAALGEIIKINSRFKKFQKNYGTGLAALTEVKDGTKTIADLIDDGLYDIIHPIYVAGFAEENIKGFNIIHSVFSREGTDLSIINPDGDDHDGDGAKVLSIKDAQRIALSLYSSYIRGGDLNLPYHLQRRWDTWVDTTGDYMGGYSAAPALLIETYKTLYKLSKDKASELLAVKDVLKGGARLYKEELEALQEKYLSEEPDRSIDHASEKIKIQFYIRKSLERIKSV